MPTAKEEEEEEEKEEWHIARSSYERITNELDIGKLEIGKIGNLKSEI